MRVVPCLFALVASAGVLACSPDPRDDAPIFIPPPYDFPTPEPAPPPLLLPAPEPLAPPDGSVFDNIPRTIVFEWQPVNEASSYTLEIDCYHCCGRNQWCTDVGQDPAIVKAGLTSASYTLDWWVGAQPGRWRVCAVDARRNEGYRSEWWGFTYTR